MSGVILKTVWPLASVVMEEGGRRSTSLPWMRKLVAVSGMLLPVCGFTPSCPVIDTCLMMFCPVTFWMTAVVEALGAEFPGELMAGLLTGLTAAGRFVTVSPVCPGPGRCTEAAAVCPLTGTVATTAWGTTLVCVAVTGTRICGPAGICGNVCVGPTDCWETAGRLGWVTTRTWGSPAELEWLTTRAVA